MSFHKYFHDNFTCETFSSLFRIHEFKCRTRLIGASHQINNEIAKWNLSCIYHQWNSQLASSFPVNYNLKKCKCNVSHHNLSTWILFYLMAFLLTNTFLSSFTLSSFTLSYPFELFELKLLKRIRKQELICRKIQQLDWTHVIVKLSIYLKCLCT